MRRRLAVTVMSIVGVGALVIPSLGSPVAAAPGHAATAYPEDWCDYPAAPPCIVSVTRAGSPISEDDPTYAMTTGGSTGSNGNYEAQWFVSDTTLGGAYASLAPAETSNLWSITVRLNHDPRSVAGYMDQMQTTTTDNGNGTWDVTTTGYPVTTGANDECEPVTPESCPYQAGEDVTLFFGQADDFQYWTPSSQWNDFDGLEQWTNIEESDLPPLVSGDPLQITEQLTNSHLLHTGAVFQGFFHAILPNAFLEDMGIDDPATLDASGVSTSIGSGTVVVVPGPTSTEIDITDITFTHRVLKIRRGTITPTRPSKLHARRLSSAVAKVSFHHSKPRGSRITHYQARCKASHHATSSGTAKHSPVKVKRLVRGVRYSCQVRAKAKVGYGKWSKGKRLAA